MSASTFHFVVIKHKIVLDLPRRINLWQFSLITISWFSSASGTVDDELSGLGVSVYNQDDFEAGVMEQLDKEVQKRNAEQKKKFLLKEYSNIKGDIR